MKKRAVIKSSIEAVSKFIADVVAEMGGTVDNMPPDVYIISILLNESLYNALEHGNKYDETKKITVDLSYENKNFVLTVEDEGTGFNWKEKMTQEKTNTKAYNGRGVFLMKKYSSQVGYNEKGNKLMLKKNFQ